MVGKLKETGLKLKFHDAGIVNVAASFYGIFGILQQFKNKVGLVVISIGQKHRPSTIDIRPVSLDIVRFD